MSSDHISTRVNSARLPDFVGKTVRLACKPIQLNGDMAIVQASDGGEVTIRAMKPDINTEDGYLEVVGNVLDATTIKMLSYTILGQDLDMKLVNDTIELIHDPRFYTRMFA
ncbi:replication factor A protein 3 [Collybia nuda]|uniref:Replication factor A protein 3 n=1 Tax=Collybia nuda TaxID=64659 RepID=A0A9P5YFE8_9AGAR|nr:replication factor A protein 3 [Collybia nuda]